MKSFKFRLAIEHLWGLTALAGIFIFVSTHPIRPHDFWWHITIGREILQTGKIPTIDIYSSTANGQPYPSYQMFWLMEIALYGIFKLGGPQLVIFIHTLLISSAYLVLFYICKLRSNSWRIAAFGVLFAAALGLNDWNVRPQGITFILASLFILAIYSYQESKRWDWLLVFPLAMLVWINSHGTFLIGLVLIGIWLIQEVWNLVKSRIHREYEFQEKAIFAPGIAFVTTVLACLINPRGLGIINYVKSLTGNTIVRNLVTEWAPPRFDSLMGVLFFTGLAVSTIILTLSPRRPTIAQIATFFIFGLLGLSTSRGSVWFGLVMAPILAEHITFIVQKYRKVEGKTRNPEGSQTLNIIFCIVIIAMCVISLPWFKQLLPLPDAKAGLISGETPVQATEILLQDNPPRQLFNAISFGSYLIWAGYPQYQVFVDSRIELFPEEVWLDYLSISNAVGDWDSLLQEYGINTLMLSPIEQPALVEAVEESDKWKSIYQDLTALIYVRK